MLKRRRHRRLLLRSVGGLMLVFLGLAAWDGLSALTGVGNYIPPPGLIADGWWRWSVHNLDTSYRSMFRRQIEHDVRAARQAARPARSVERDSSPVHIPVEPIRGFTVSRRLSERYPPDTAFFTKDRERLNILIYGVDSRLGRERARADAIHLVSIDLDLGLVEVVSVPRGLYSYAGYKAKNSNIIANVLASRGRDRFLRAVEKICGMGPISYYIEVGFSQAIGILELLGYENPALELQALRTRKGFQYGDVNRSYNQGEFICMLFRRYFPLLTGVKGEVLIRGGLALVESNLTVGLCRGIVFALERAGFPSAAASVTHEMRGRFKKRFTGLPRNTDETAADKAVSNLRYKSLRGKRPKIAAKLQRLLARCKKYRKPGSVIRRLERIVEQHAWLQVPVDEERWRLRDSLVALLSNAYLAQGDTVKYQVLKSKMYEEYVLFKDRELLFSLQRK